MEKRNGGRNENEKKSKVWGGWWERMRQRRSGGEGLCLYTVCVCVRVHVCVCVFWALGDGCSDSPWRNLGPLSRNIRAEKFSLCPGSLTSATHAQNSLTQTHIHRRHFIKCVWHVECHTYPKYELRLKTSWLRRSWSWPSFDWADSNTADDIIHAQQSSDTNV